jgi:hypothetical protein
MRRRAFVLGAIGLAGLAWLAVSDGPNARRMRKINDAIRSGGLGQLPALARQRLELQFPWLAQISGVQSRVRINQEIDPAQLNLVVTTPEFEDITGCGLWNALYDPSLQTIFIDRSLVWPIELLVEGDKGTFSMYRLDDINVVVGFLNFILAHELGHWRRRSPTAGCFVYAMPREEAPFEKENFAEEQAADALAVSAIMEGFQQGSVPPLLMSLNSAQLFGSIIASPAEMGAMDIIVSMLEITRKMLFSAGPYSPYFADSRHPNFLRRCESAIRSLTATDNRTSLIDRMPLVREELHRMAGLPSLAAHEVVFPEPISNLDIRDGLIWLGTVPVQPTPTSQNDKLTYPDERLFSVSLASIEDAGHRKVIPLNESRLTGNSKPGPNEDPYTTPGAWIGKLFDEGHRKVGLPAPGIPGPRPDHGHDEYSSFPGFLYTGTRWTWVDAAGESRTVDEVDLKALIAAKGHADVSLGPLQRSERDILVPFVAQSDTSATTFRVARLAQNEPDQLTLDQMFVVPLGRRPVDASTAVYSENTWWMSSFSTLGAGREAIHVLRLGPGAQLLDYAHIPALVSLLPPDAPKNMRGRYAPREPRSLLLSNGLILMGYVGDSLFVVNPRMTTCKIIFHPIEDGLRVSDCGGGKVLLGRRTAGSVT